MCGAERGQHLCRGEFRGFHGFVVVLAIGGVQGWQVAVGLGEDVQHLHADLTGIDH